MKKEIRSRKLETTGLPDGMRFRTLCFGLAAAHAGLFTYFALAQVPVPLPLGLPLRQMILHVFAYGILALLLSGAWLPASRKARPVILIGAALASFSYGVLLEAVQALLPWRSFAWYDLLFNGLGVAVGVAAVGWLFRGSSPLSSPLSERSLSLRPSGAKQEATTTSCRKRSGEMDGSTAGIA